MVLVAPQKTANSQRVSGLLLYPPILLIELIELPVLPVLIEPPVLSALPALKKKVIQEIIWQLKFF